MNRKNNAEFCNVIEIHVLSNFPVFGYNRSQWHVYYLSTPVANWKRSYRYREPNKIMQILILPTEDELTKAYWGDGL